jgi:hypothetical protein
VIFKNGSSSFSSGVNAYFAILCNPFFQLVNHQIHEEYYLNQFSLYFLGELNNSFFVIKESESKND